MPYGVQQLYVLLLFLVTVNFDPETYVRSIQVYTCIGLQLKAYVQTLYKSFCFALLAGYFALYTKRVRLSTGRLGLSPLLLC